MALAIIDQPAPAASITRRQLTFSNPKLSTKAAERRRLAARIIRRFGQLVDVVVIWMVAGLIKAAPALRAWADRLDAGAKARQTSAAKRALHAWAVQETTPSTRTPPAAFDAESMAEMSARERVRAVCQRCGKRTSASFVGEKCWGFVGWDDGEAKKPCGGSFRLGR